MPSITSRTAAISVDATNQRAIQVSNNRSKFVVQNTELAAKFGEDKLCSAHRTLTLQANT